jgi:hypothetical protein
MRRQHCLSSSQYRLSSSHLAEQLYHLIKFTFLSDCIQEGHDCFFDYGICLHNLKYKAGQDSIDSMSMFLNNAKNAGKGAHFQNFVEPMLCYLFHYVIPYGHIDFDEMMWTHLSLLFWFHTRQLQFKTEFI